MDKYSNAWPNVLIFSSTHQKLFQMVNTVRTSFVNDLDSCKNEDCLLKYIRALKNLQNSKTLPSLVHYAKGKSRKVAIAAIRAIQTFPHYFIDDQVRSW